VVAKQRAAARVLKTAEETLQRVQELLDATAKRGSGRSPKAAASLEQTAQDVVAARREYQRLAGQHEMVTQSIRIIGHAYHFVDLEHGVRRNGKLIAWDIQGHIDTIRTVAQQEHLSQACLERIEKAERVVPKMQATVEFVSGYVPQQVRQLDVAPPVSYAMHAHLIPSYYLERVALTRTVAQGEPLFASGGALETLSAVEQSQLKARRPSSRRCASAPSPMWKGVMDTSRCATTNCEDWTSPGNGCV
jgi:hypothetical protein